MVEMLDENTREFGIVHGVGPELRLPQPGMCITRCDSHTAIHGAR